MTLQSKAEDQVRAQELINEFSTNLTKPLTTSNTTIEGLNKAHLDIQEQLTSYLQNLGAKLEKDPQAVIKKIERLKICYQNYINLIESLVEFANERNEDWQKHAKNVRDNAELLNSSILTLPQKIAMPFIDFIGVVVGAVCGILIGLIGGFWCGFKSGTILGLALGIVLGPIGGVVAGPAIGGFAAHNYVKNSFFSPATFNRVEKIAQQYVSEKENEEGGIGTKVRNAFS